MKQAFIPRSLVAAAVLAQLVALAPAQAQDVSVYGAIGLDLRYSSGLVDGSGKGKSLLTIQDNAIVNSRVGIKGGEDLGSGLKAEFDLESSLGPDVGSAGGGTFWNRNAFVGLKGGFGTVRVGHQWNVADDYMCGYFVCAFYAPFLLQGFGALSDYYDNTIKYSSPNVGGLEGGVSYTMGEVAGKNTAGQKFQGAVNYGMGPFGVGAVLFSEKDPNGGSGNTMYALGAAYDLGPAKVRAGVSKAEQKYSYDGKTKLSTAIDFKATLIDLGVDLPVSAVASVSVDYVMDDVSKGGDDLSFLRLRGTYALSKRTSLNANAIYLKNSGSGTYGFGGATESGKSQTLLTAGITHAF